MNSYLAHRKRPALTMAGQPSLTKQQFKDECNLGKLMKRYINHGIPPPSAGGNPTYGNFTTVDDYFDAVNKLKEAQEQFDALPSKLRDRFNNAPSELLMFLLNEKNREEAIALGIIPAPPKEPAPQKVTIVNPETLEQLEQGIERGGPRAPDKSKTA